jgi:hypothetical protein
MKLKTLLLIFILYTPFANAVNLVCQAYEKTSYIASWCQDGCEHKSDEAFSIIFDSNKNKIIEVTDFSLGKGEEVYNEEITPSSVYFELPTHWGKVDINIKRASGNFWALQSNGKDKWLNTYDGKCRVGKKLF